jgi:hypothetical protein
LELWNVSNGTNQLQSFVRSIAHARKGEINRSPRL